MNPKRKKRLWLVIGVVVFSTVGIGLIAYGLSGNINLFYPPAEVVAGKAPHGQAIRVGGMVVEGSIQRSNTSLEVRFEVTDYAAVVPVVYSGILPDLFDEGQGVVAAGMLTEQGLFQATEVLAKHDENYMPPEVVDALEKAGRLP